MHEESVYIRAHVAREIDRYCECVLRVPLEFVM